MKFFATITLCFYTLISLAQTEKEYDRIFDSLRNNGKADQVIPYFLKELKSKPKNEIVLRYLGYANLLNNQLDEADKYYKEALNVNSKCGRCYLNLARIQVKRGDYKKSIEYMDRAVEAAPKDAYLFSARANLKADTKDELGALLDYETAIELEPENINFYIERGKYNAEQNHFYSALSDLNKAVELQPDNYRPYFERSSIYYSKGMLDESMKDVNKAIQLDSSHAELYLGRGAIHAMNKEYRKAMIDYDKSIKMDPNDFTAYYNKALQHHAMEDMSAYCNDLSECYAVLIKYDPANTTKLELEDRLNIFCDSSKVSFYYQRGIAYYNLEKYDKAVEIYSKGIRKFPDNSMSLCFRGNAYLALREYTKAIEDYNTSLKYKDNFVEDIKANQGHTQITGDMENYTKEIIASLYLSLAEAKYALGKYNEALLDINKAIEGLPEMSEQGKEVYYNVRGNVYMALGDYQKAFNDFDKCIQVNSYFAIAYVNRAITKINLVNKIKIKSHSIRGGIGNQTFNSNWVLPAKLPVKKSDPNLLSAVADCNKAIELESNMEYAFYVRGQIKKMLEQGDYCQDLIFAKEKGYPVEEEVVKNCKK